MSRVDEGCMTFEELELMRRTAPPGKHPASQRFMDIMQELMDLHDMKGRDYGNDKDPFANVSSSSDFGIEPWKAAMVRANDKMKRIQRYACTGTLANEGVIDSFNDLAVYAVIGRVLFERSRQ